MFKVDNSCDFIDSWKECVDILHTMLIVCDTVRVKCVSILKVYDNDVLKVFSLSFCVCLSCKIENLVCYIFKC